MNREIKFRIWVDAIGKGEMVYPKYITLHKDGCIESDRFLGGIAMQFTGIKDKNGKEIIEAPKEEIKWEHLTIEKKGSKIIITQNYYISLLNTFTIILIRNLDKKR